MLLRSNLARYIDQSILTKGKKKDRNWKMRVFKIVFSGSHHFQHYCTDCLYEGSGWFVEDDKRSGPLCYFQKKISTFYSVYQVTWKLDRFNSTKELTLNGCLMDIFSFGLFFFIEIIYLELWFWKEMIFLLNHPQNKKSDSTAITL